MKRIVLTAVIFCAAFFEMWGQNLVPNGDFEDTMRCSIDSTSLIPRFWYSPTNGTPDYFYTNNNYNASCPVTSAISSFKGYDTTNGFGSQTPRSGLAYSGFVIAYGQEYMAVPLTDSLIAGKKYCLEAYVSLAEGSLTSLDLIQFCLSRDSITRYDSTGVYNFFLDSAQGAQADVENMPGNFIIDTTGWVLVADTFIAQGGERFLTIGTFDSLQGQYVIVDSLSYNVYSYFYFDDISVYMCGNPDGINETNLISEISLTPNPSNGEFILKGNFPEKTTIEIFDLLGQKILEENIPQGIHTVPVILNLSGGIYLYRVISNKHVLHSDRMVIVR